MNITLKTRKVGEVTEIDAAGPTPDRRRGERLAQLGRQVSEERLLNIARRFVYRPRWTRRTRRQLYIGDKSRGQLKLLNLTKRVSEMFQIMALVTVFEVYDDEARAIPSVSTAARA
jgi:anti-sigma B factor antagonist